MTPEQLRADLDGALIPAVPVPFSKPGVIDQDAQRTYVSWMAGQDVDAVAVWAHTGRGLRMDPDQRLEVLETWTGEFRGHVVAGVGVPEQVKLPTDARTRTDAVALEMAKMATEAQQAGAVAALVHPPSALRDLKGLDDRILACHEAVTDVLPAVAFYLYDAAGGIAYSNELVLRLVTLPAAIGIKFATLDNPKRVAELCGLVSGLDALPITGEDRFLGQSLTLGCRGALIGMAAALPDIFCALLGTDPEDPAWQSRSRAIDGYAEVAFADPVEGYVQRMLWALHDDGVLTQDPVDPWAPDLAAAERDAMQAAVLALRAAA